MGLNVSFSQTIINEISIIRLYRFQTHTMHNHIVHSSAILANSLEIRQLDDQTMGHLLAFKTLCKLALNKDIQAMYSVTAEQIAH